MIGGMKKAKAGDAGPKSMDRISDLPKEILHRILYFLSQKEAVRTCVLSKSWRYIWCTRPNLDFDFSDTFFKGNNQYFLSLVDKTLQRYSDQRLCVEEFSLDISLLGNDSDHESVSLLENWIPRFTTIGVKEFCLYIYSNQNQYTDLPSVVFKAESLKLLCLWKCNLGQKIPENIPFVRLQELQLHNVLIKQEIYDKIISSCPLLTTMWLEECEGLKTINLEKKIHKYLKHFIFINYDTYAYDQCSIEIDVPTIETIKIIGSEIRFRSHTKFSNLKYLSLEEVEISTSNSIEQSQLICHIDAPNIERFTYLGSFIPSISYSPTVRRSKLELCLDGIDNAQSWFLKLSKLLQALRHSNIFLHIFQFSHGNMVQIQQDDIINGGNYKPVVVEDLELNCVDLTPSFLNWLFCICRPRKIIRIRLPQEGLKKERLIEYFCNIRERENNQDIIWRDLEDLSFEGFDMSLRQWQPLQGKTLSESALPNIHNIFIRLQWSEACESISKPLEL